MEINGTENNDVLQGTVFDDTIKGEGGNDRLFGNAGNDILEGGAGDDVIDGGAGDDTINGGDGADTLLGGSGNDRLIGGLQKDYFDGGDGIDTLDGNTGLATQVVVVDLSKNYRYIAAADFYETVINIENVWGNDATADTITGNSGANHLIGFGGNDILNGLDGNDILEGGAGDDVIDGGAGDDTSVYSSFRADYSTTSNSTNITVSDSRQNRDGSDKLFSVEKISFLDGSLVFDVASSNAAAAYRLYGGAFARTPDEGGFRFWTSTLDKNVSLRDVATQFISSSEFIARYGSSLSNGAFVDALYQNVLSRGGDAGGVAYWNQQLDNKLQDRSDVLVQFTQLPEFVGISAANISNGYWVV
jgi:Ca2+-binding RTX toxin-like protein